MKLAEALIERKAITLKIQDIQGRINSNMIVNVGDEPVENPEDLLKQLVDLVCELGNLIKRINETNNTALVENGDTITVSIVNRDMLNMRHKQLESIIMQSSRINQSRYTKDDIKEICLLNVNEIRKEMDSISKSYRELDTLIQAANWGSNLVD